LALVRTDPKIGGLNRLSIQPIAKAQQQFTEVAHPVGARAVCLLQRLGQPQLLDVLFVTLFRQCGDRVLVFCDGLFSLCQLFFARDEQLLEFVDVIGQGCEEGSVVNDMESINGRQVSRTRIANKVADCFNMLCVGV
jgi:hypothetical protein